jgi:peptidoglycan/xylan/chitin deacetylase (PgdA/CDA1 family)
MLDSLGNKCRRFTKQIYESSLELAKINNIKHKKSGLVVLMLHKVNCDADPLPITIDPKLLESIIYEIKRNHQFINLEFIHNNKHLLYHAEKLLFAVTFDDGYLDNYTNAFPILHQEKVPFTIFISNNFINREKSAWYELLWGGIKHSKSDIIDLSDYGFGKQKVARYHDKCLLFNILNTDLKRFNNSTREIKVADLVDRFGGCDAVETPAMMTWDMIKELSSKGVIIGSHTISHPILSRENPKKLHNELFLSKREIELRINKPIYGFAYPNGTKYDFDNRMDKLLRKAEFRYACTTIKGINESLFDSYYLRRVNIHNEMCSNNLGEFSPSRFWSRVLGVM